MRKYVKRLPPILKWTYVLLPAAAALAIVLTEVWPKGQPFATYGPPVFAELAGIFLTIAVIERILEFQREREQATIKLIVLRRIRATLMARVVALLWHMYESLAMPPNEDTYPIAFLDDWATRVRNLDADSPALYHAGMTWGQRTQIEVEFANQELREQVIEYGRLLSSALITAVEDLVDDLVWKSLLRMAVFPPREAVGDGYVLKGLPIGGPEAFVSKIKTVIARYDDEAAGTSALPIDPSRG
jgi:hypothetical protein